MSTACGTLDQAAPSAHPHAQQPLADRSGQQPGGWSPYVGLHRRRDGQGLDLVDAQHRFHDAVRARVPGVEPLPEPTPPDRRLFSEPGPVPRLTTPRDQ